MNRFNKRKIPIIKYLSKFLPASFFIVMLILFLLSINSVSDTTMDKQYDSLTTALEHSIAQCYAIEGSYPESADYLTEHYGLTYNHDTFLIEYTYYGSNIYPDYVVLYRTGNVMIQQ